MAVISIELEIVRTLADEDFWLSFQLWKLNYPEFLAQNKQQGNASLNDWYYTV